MQLQATIAHTCPQSLLMRRKISLYHVAYAWILPNILQHDYTTVELYRRSCRRPCARRLRTISDLLFDFCNIVLTFATSARSLTLYHPHAVEFGKEAILAL